MSLVLCEDVSISSYPTSMRPSKHVIGIPSSYFPQIKQKIGSLHPFNQIENRLIISQKLGMVLTHPTSSQTKDMLSLSKRVLSLLCLFAWVPYLMFFSEKWELERIAWAKVFGSKLCTTEFFSLCTFHCGKFRWWSSPCLIFLLATLQWVNDGYDK